MLLRQSSGHCLGGVARYKDSHLSYRLALGSLASTSPISHHPLWGLPPAAYLLSPPPCSLSLGYGCDGGIFPEGGVKETPGLLSPSPPPQFSSVTQSRPTLCDPMDCSTSGFPVHHQLLELTQTDVH